MLTHSVHDRREGSERCRERVQQSSKELCRSGAKGNSPNARAKDQVAPLSSLFAADRTQPQSSLSAKSGEWLCSHSRRGHYSSLPDRKGPAPKPRSAKHPSGWNPSGHSAGTRLSPDLICALPRAVVANLSTCLAGAATRSTTNNKSLQMYSCLPVHEYLFHDKR